MLEWTGERFLPWLEQSLIAYEHLHRYAYATMFVKGKRVLDLASGEGYGSKMMSDTAASVIGVEIDDKTVEHAQSKYRSKNLHFLKGSISAIPITDDHSFDVIVCFEAIEHIEDHDQLLKEVKRLLKADGIFLVSTPNKLTYHDEAHDENPFHMKELYFDDFKKLLTAHFRSVSFLGQQVHPSSNIWPLSSVNTTGIQEVVIERVGSEFQFIPSDKRSSLYFIALATDTPPIVHTGSVLIDSSDELFNDNRKAIEARDQTIASLEKGEKWHEEQIANQAKTIASLEEAVDWRGTQIDELNKGLEWIQKQLADNEGALEWRARQVESLEREKADLMAAFQSAQRQLNVASEKLEAIYASSGWKFILRIRHLRDRLRRIMGLGTSPVQQ
jgi:SAM-dependent methyltransferase